MIYFLPNLNKAAVEDAELKAAGLEYALTGAGVSCQPHARGPGDLAGVLVTINRLDGTDLPTKFQPDKQTWRKGTGGKFWVGFNHDARPGPQDLVRQRVYPGSEVKLLDGNSWMIPQCVAVLEDRHASLPLALDLDEDGEITGRVHPAYEQLCNDAWTFWEDFLRGAAEKATMNFADQMRLAVAALAVNYRLSRIEAIGLLKLLGTDEVRLILRAAIDADEIERHYKALAEKKRTEAVSASATNSGGPDSSSTTASASPPSPGS